MNILTKYNTNFIEHTIDIIIHAFKHSIMVIPFLFLSYLLIEFIHHKHSRKMNQILVDKEKYAPIIGGVLGVVPQCGFSSTIASLYSAGVVSLGTLLSVFISTSDEAILILIAYPEFYKTLILLILIKLVLGITVGLLFNKFSKEKILINKVVEEECCCKKKHSIMKASLKHTVNIFIFLFIFSLIIECIVHLVGIDTLNNILLNGSIFQPIIASVIGLIPSCAASVLLTNLYITNSISFASLLAGLICNAGIGLLVLFRCNKKLIENIKILGFLVTLSIVVGVITSLIIN